MTSCRYRITAYITVVANVIVDALVHVLFFSRMMNSCAGPGFFFLFLIFGVTFLG